MIPYCLLTATLFIAAFGVWLLLRACGPERQPSWPSLLLSLSLAVFVYLFGAWVFLSVYLKYVFGACWVLTLVFVLFRKRTITVISATPGRTIINLFFVVVLGSLSVLYFTGTTGEPYGIARLTFPFGKGTYFVFQGGKGLPTNVFHYGLRGAVYAMDIVKLNSFGNRASQVFSSRLDDYAIFSDTIYSPCNGIVAHTAGNNPDNIPPARKRGPTNTNHVLIQTASFYVFLGHMRYGQVFVSAGDSVRAGQPLGLVGNSGFSIEPHLHIQVHARTNDAIPWYKERPLLIEFDGRSYLLFEEIRASGRL